MVSKDISLSGRCSTWYISSIRAFGMDEVVMKGQCVMKCVDPKSECSGQPFPSLICHRRMVGVARSAVMYGELCPCRRVLVAGA